jgi:hypothetical protein
MGSLFCFGHLGIAVANSSVGQDSGRKSRCALSSKACNVVFEQLEGSRQSCNGRAGSVHPGFLHAFDCCL